MNISEEMIRRIVEQVVAETSGCNNDLDYSLGFERQKDPSGIIGVHTGTIKCEPFEAEGVSLKDVTTLEEAPRMGAGLMEIDHSQLEWTLTYDEFDICLEGKLTIEIDGRHVSANVGDMIYIPKGSHIHFQSLDGYCKYAYTVYPANWADLC